MPAMISNDKPARRYRRERNLVAKNNKHKGGYHTPGKFERKRKLVTDHYGMSVNEINDWWESSIWVIMSPSYANGRTIA